MGTPDPGAFWRVIAEYGVVAFFTAPTAFRAIRKEDPNAEFLKKYDLSKFRTLFLAGERADPPTLEWAEQILGVPVVDHWWQTETGWCIAGNPVGLGLLPVKHGSPTVPMPGWDVQVVDESAKPVADGNMGSIVIKLPLPPGALPTLWQNDARMKESYLEEFPGFYKTVRRRLSRYRWLSLYHGPHGRYHQRRWPSSLHRRHGRGSGLPSRCRRMCCHWRGRIH